MAAKKTTRSDTGRNMMGLQAEMGVIVRRPGNPLTRWRKRPFVAISGTLLQAPEAGIENGYGRHLAGK
jgi:hypothetical protein